MEIIKLALLRIKYLLVHKRPVPLLCRKICEECSFVFNKDLYKSCPLCGYGADIAYVVRDYNYIYAIFKSKKRAEKGLKSIQMEYGATVYLEEISYGD